MKGNLKTKKESYRKKKRNTKATPCTQTARNKEEVKQQSRPFDYAEDGGNGVGNSVIQT